MTEMDKNNAEEEWSAYVFDKDKAPRLHEGWMVMFRYLVEHEVVAKPELVAATMGGSDLAARTCKNLVNEAARRGWVYRIVGGKKATFFTISELGLSKLKSGNKAGPESGR